MWYNKFFPILILARIVQAIGAAGTMANNQGIITETFPPHERGKALGFLGTSVALGSLIGPGLGGLIVGAASWEYIFLINVPIGVIALFYAIKLLPKGNKTVKGKLDILGAVLFMFAIVPLFGALDEGLKHWLFRSNDFIELCHRNCLIYNIYFCGKEKRRSSITIKYI